MEVSILNHLKSRVETVIAGEGELRHPCLTAFLSMASVVHSGVTKMRAKCYQKGVFATKRLPCRVISVGNITVGGTGKTPMAIYVARLVQRLGYSAAIISRGYKGEAENAGGIVSDGWDILLGPNVSGDEPHLMAASLPDIPVLVGKDRYSSGRRAIEAFGPDVIVLDDAFQHLRLARDVDLALLDHRRPFGNGRLLPRGPLREPLSALVRADAFIMTRTEASPSSSPSAGRTPSKRLTAITENKPLFYTSHAPFARRMQEGWKGPVHEALRHPPSADPTFLKGRDVYAFSGIARNDDFRRTLVERGCRIVGFAGFDDHHPYTEADLKAICKEAKEKKADCIATTEKDAARMSQRVHWPMELVILGVEIRFSADEDAFAAFIERKLRRAAD